MKYGFWQIQIAKEDRYKTSFSVVFGHYEWNVMTFLLLMNMDMDMDMKSVV